MKLSIANNIRACRKERKLTQEQLAEALGVTVGAVSKWESGASMPDVSLIVEMADFFETSVDVLLGYEWRGGSMGEALKRIKALRNEKRFEEASAEAEKALLKYPNRFDVAFSSAVMYSLKGVERRCQKSFRRALTLFERSLELIGQNTDERVNEWSIRNYIADVHLSLGQAELALEQMKKNNADGLNNGPIGFTLAVTEHKPDEALPYLSDALTDGVTKLFRVVIGYVNAYLDLKDYASALAVLEWMRSAVDGLRMTGTPSYLDKEIAQIETACTIAAMLNGDPESARAYLRKAIAAAEIFDAAPAYDFAGTRFFHGDKATTAFDDFGVTAMEGVRRTLMEQDEIAEKLTALWNEQTIKNN